MRLMLTSQCSQSCPDCVHKEQYPTHMTEDTVNAFIEFYERIKPTPKQFISSRMYDVLPKSIVIAGGECTEHPDFEARVTQLVEALPACDFYLETNGSWIADEDKVDAVYRVMQHDNIKTLAFVSDPSFSYYPRFSLDKEKFEGFLEAFPTYRHQMDALQGDTFIPGKQEKTYRGIVIDDMCLGEQLLSFDKERHLTYTSLLPCFYFHYLKQETSSFGDLLYTAESNGCMILPLISPTGSIHNGISQKCLSLGHIASMDPDALYPLLTTIPDCQRCHRDLRMTEDIARIISQAKRFS